MPGYYHLVKPKSSIRSTQWDSDGTTHGATFHIIPIETLAIVMKRLTVDRDYQSLGRLMQTRHAINHIVSPEISKFYRPRPDFICHIETKPDESVEILEGAVDEAKEETTDVTHSSGDDSAWLPRQSTIIAAIKPTLTTERADLVKYLILDHLPSLLHEYLAWFERSEKTVSFDLAFRNASVLVFGSNATLHLFRRNASIKSLRNLCKPGHICLDLVKSTKEQLQSRPGRGYSSLSFTAITTPIHNLVEDWPLESITYHNLNAVAELPSSHPLVRYEIRKARVPTREELISYIDGAVTSYEEEVRVERFKKRQLARIPSTFLATLTANPNMLFPPTPLAVAAADDSGKPDHKPGPLRSAQMGVHLHRHQDMQDLGDLEGGRSGV